MRNPQRKHPYILSDLAILRNQHQLERASPIYLNKISFGKQIVPVSYLFQAYNYEICFGNLLQLNYTSLMELVLQVDFSLKLRIISYATIKYSAFYLINISENEIYYDKILYEIYILKIKELLLSYITILCWNADCISLNFGLILKCSKFQEF